MSIYFDHNASSPLHPQVLEAMLPFMQSAHGNASSLHRSGRFLRSAIDGARVQVAALVNARPDEVIFTSGGSEANNTAVKSFIDLHAPGHWLSSPLEHASLLGPLHQAERAGKTLHWLLADQQGRVDPATATTLCQQFSPQLISLQLANNETGVLQPVQQIVQIARSHADCLIHSDATQAVGKVEVDMQQLDVDLLTLSGHKFNAPQAVGALVVKSATLREPLISGGHQESGRRAGTENVALLVGLGKAAELARINLFERHAFLLELRRHFEHGLAQIGGVHIFGAEAERLPNTSYFALPYYHGETLLMQLDKAGFECSSGSACQSAVTKPSHVLSAMQVNEDLALNAVRVSFGMDNTIQQVDQLIATLNTLINQLPAIMRQAAS